ncbi:MAG: hypothetical protein RIF33_20105, partial [Cyclobacteriaceae bacterium]
MKNISRLLIILLSASFILSSCEDEDVLGFPDFTVPVILLATNVTGDFDWSDLSNSTYSFTLGEENFDGAADGHKFYVGRSGTVSTLQDVTLFITYDGETSVLQTLQGSELPTTVSVTAAEATSLTGADISMLSKGDGFLITYEYNIDSNNSGNIVNVGTPGADYCGGFTNEGEFCSLNIPVSGTALSVATSQAEADTVLRAGATDSVTVAFSNPLASLVAEPAITAANGTLTELSRSASAIIFSYTAASGFTGADTINVGAASIVAATGNIDAIAASSITVAVDDTAPTYGWEFGAFSVSDTTATLGIALSEALAPLALDSATVSVTSASFDNVTDAFLSVSGRTGTI